MGLLCNSCYVGINGVKFPCCYKASLWMKQSAVRAELVFVNKKLESYAAVRQKKWLFCNLACCLMAWLLWGINQPLFDLSQHQSVLFVSSPWTFSGTWSQVIPANLSRIGAFQHRNTHSGALTLSMIIVHFWHNCAKNLTYILFCYIISKLGWEGRGLFNFPEAVSHVCFTQST